MGEESRWAEECARTPGRRRRLRAYEGEATFEEENRGTFDELAVDHWLHVEEMDERLWLVRIGDRGFLTTVNEDGSVTLREARDQNC